MSRYPAAIVSYIKEHYKGNGHQAMADALNTVFGTEFTATMVKSFYHNHHLNCGLTGRFQRGHVPFNKGMKGIQPHPNSIATQFKPGHLPANTKPVGTLEIRSDGYVYRKVSERNVWELEQVRVYSESHGPIPNGHKVIFLDGDPRNCALENLALVSNETHLELNRRHLRYDNAALTGSGVLIAKARVAIRHARNRREAFDDEHPR